MKKRQLTAEDDTASKKSKMSDDATEDTKSDEATKDAKTDEATKDAKSDKADETEVLNTSFLINYLLTKHRYFFLK